MVLFYLPTYRPTYLPACLPACPPACLPACLSVCLSVPACAYLPMTTVYAYRLCLPSVPTCLCLPVCNLGEGPAQSKALPDSID